jgi:hypothetical protein
VKSLIVLLLGLIAGVESEMPSRKKEIDKLQRELQVSRILKGITKLWKENPGYSLSEFLPLGNLSDEQIEKLINKKLKGYNNDYR